MTKTYASTLGFGLVGLVFLVIFFDSRRLGLLGEDPMAVLDGAAIYALVATFLLGYGARLIFSAKLSDPIRRGMQIVLSTAMVSIIIGTVVGCAQLIYGLQYALFAKVFLIFAVLSSLSAALWLARFSRIM